jgi:flagellar biosynthetic protein FliQ
MGIDEFIQLGQVAVETAAWVSAPVLVFGLVAGLFVSIFQAATQISDASLAFIPKIGAAVAGLVLFGNFMISRIAGFTIWVYTQIGTVSPH